MKPLPSASKGWRWLGGLCCLALLSAVLVGVLLPMPAGDPPEGAPTPRPAGVEEPRAVADADRVTAPTEVDAALWEFEPSEVLANADCGIAAGWGMPAGDVALLVLPGGAGEPGAGARFAVLDERGTLFGGDLPFRPNHWRLGRRPDGGVVTAFGDLRLNSKVSRPPESPEPLRVYLDGGLVYKSEKAWNFGVARDGSSFFAVEPLAGRASRLVIRNLDLGVEIHHDLGAEFNPFTPAESPYGASYTRDAAEVAFWPPQQRDGVLGDHWFYPVGGGDPRVVRAVSARTGMPLRSNAAADSVDPRMVRIERVEDRREDRLVFDSSEVVYHIADKSPTWRGGGPFEVARYAYGGYGSADGPRRAEVWRRTVPMHVATWSRAPDGPWLALREGARRVFVLDTSTGELVLTFPTVEDAARRVPERLRWRQVPDGGGMNHWQWAWASATLARLRGVLGPEATVGDVGSLGGSWFEDGNRLVLSRSIGEYPDIRTVHDVFEMETVGVDGGPAFRLEKDDVACGLGGLRGLEMRDGRLVYPGPRAAPTSDRAWIEREGVVDEREMP